MMLRFRNCRVLRVGEFVDDDLWVDVNSGKIVDPLRLFYEKTSLYDDAKVVDCRGCLVVPGFIDLQCNGGFGLDFSDPNTENGEALVGFARKLLATGVTSFCATLISMQKADYDKLIPRFAPLDGRKLRSAHLLGIHLEGPYFSPEKVGAHPPENIVSPQEATLDEIYGDNLNDVKIVTIAPEVQGAMPLIERLTKNMEIIVSIGHSAAKLSDADRAFEAGARMITHLFNAMGAFHHRDPGIIGLLGRHEILDKLFYGIIADGLHADRTSVAMAYQSHPEGAVLVTDAMAGMGLPEGQHRLGSQLVDIKQGEIGKQAVLHGTETLAGSVVSMIECVRNFKEFTGCRLSEAVEAATAHPARLLGIDEHKGSLNFGCDADIVLLQPNTLEVLETYVMGEKVFDHQSFIE